MRFSVLKWVLALRLKLHFSRQKIGTLPMQNEYIVQYCYIIFGVAFSFLMNLRFFYELVSTRINKKREISRKTSNVK